MFFGQFEHSIDDKGRLTIPARFRDIVGETVYITQGFDNNLMALPSEAYEQLSKEIMSTSVTDPNARDLKRQFFANTSQSEIDKAGRILIPSYLRDLAGIINEAVVVGNGTFFEIWARERWIEKNTSLQDPEKNARKYVEFNIPI
jgi:MraZ protein